MFSKYLISKCYELRSYYDNQPRTKWNRFKRRCVLKFIRIPQHWCAWKEDRRYYKELRELGIHPKQLARSRRRAEKLIAKYENRTSK